MREQKHGTSGVSLTHDDSRGILCVSPLGLRTGLRNNSLDALQDVTPCIVRAITVYSVVKNARAKECIRKYYLEKLEWCNFQIDTILEKVICLNSSLIDITMSIILMTYDIASTKWSVLLFARVYPYCYITRDTTSLAYFKY